MFRNIKVSFLSTPFLAPPPRNSQKVAWQQSFFSGDIYLFLIIIAPPQAVKGLHSSSVEFTVRSACPGSAFHWWWWVIVGALPNLPTSGSSGKVGSVGAPYLGHVGRVKWANACNALKHTKCSGKVRFYHSCYYFIYMMMINHLY